MLKTRVIPCLLLENGGLVKTVKFKSPKYVGDPINAIKIFNDKEVDELVLLDISASELGKGPNFEVIEQVASECFMPLAYGGGIATMPHVRRILKLGVEKVILNTAAWNNRQLLVEAAREFGTQAIVASIDFKRTLFGKHEVFVNRGRKGTGKSLIDYAQEMEASGAGELMITSIDRDGTMSGYAIEQLAKVSAAVSIPVIASGGAGSLQHMKEAVAVGHAAAVAAGAMFVFHGPHRAVLITYPTQAELERHLG